jgi:hypothetical protein
LQSPPGPAIVEVAFDPALVARFQRLGATAHRGVAAALYEVELRQPAAMIPAGDAAAPAAVSPHPGDAAAPPAAASRPGGSRQKAAAAPRPAGARGSLAAPGPAGSADDEGDRIVAVLRAVSRGQPRGPDRAVGGAAARRPALPDQEVPRAGQVVLAERVVRLSELRPSLAAASPALRASALAIELAQALAAKDPAPGLRELRARARALAAEMPDDPKIAELLQLVERAADLAATPGHARQP